METQENQQTQPQQVNPQVETEAPATSKRNISYFALVVKTEKEANGEDPREFIEILEAKTKTDLAKVIRDADGVEVIRIFKGKEIEFKVKAALNFC